MISIYNLKTVQKTLTGQDTGTDLGIGAVPEGKTRFVVWVKLHAPSTNMVSFGPATTPTAIGALTSVADKQGLTDDETISYPDTINPDACIFSIEGAATDVFLGVITTAGVARDTELTLVYYDA